MAARLSRRYVLITIGIAIIVSLVAVHAQKVFEWYGKVNGMVGDEIISMDLSGGELWAATTWADPNADEAPLEGGISLLDQETGNFTTYTPEQGLAHVKVWDLLVDGKKIWCGTPRGLSVLDTSKLADLDPFEVNQAFTTYTTKDGLIEDDVRSIAKDGDVMWLGTNEGMSSFNTKTNNWTQFSPDELPGKTVHSLSVYGAEVWLGTSGGLAKYDKESGQFETFTLPTEGVGSDIIYVVRAEEEAVWAGTRVGVIRLDKATSEWTVYGEGDLPDVWITEIVLMDEEVWVATLKGGVAILNRQKGKWKVVNEKKGLASNDVRGIEPAGEITWIGTARGLNRYDPAAATKLMMRNLLIGLAIAAVIGGIVAAKLTILKPSPEEIEKRKKEQEARARRKERKRTGPRPWEICKGVPKKDLCGRCKYNRLKAGKLHCSKYDIDLEKAL